MTKKHAQDDIQLLRFISLDRRIRWRWKKKGDGNEPIVTAWASGKESLEELQMQSVYKTCRNVTIVEVVVMRVVKQDKKETHAAVEQKQQLLVKLPKR